MNMRQQKKVMPTKYLLAIILCSVLASCQNIPSSQATKVAIAKDNTVQQSADECKGYPYIRKEYRIDYDTVWTPSQCTIVVKPESEKDEMFFIDQRTGYKLFNKTYQAVKNFSEGLAAVKENGKWGFIDLEGKVVIPLIYDEASSFDVNVTYVKQNDQYSFIDKTGRVLIKNIDEVENNPKSGIYSYGRIKAGIPNIFLIQRQGKWGAINTNGDIILELKFDELELLSNVRVMLKDKGRYSVYDSLGNLIAPQSDKKYQGLFNSWFYLESEDKAERKSVVYPIDSPSFITSYEIYDIDFIGKDYLLIKGDTALESEYHHSDSLGKYRKKVINSYGEIVVDNEYDMFLEPINGVFGVIKNNKLGFVNDKGKEIVPPEYEHDNDWWNWSFDVLAFEFSKYGGKLLKNNKWAMVNHQGKILTPFEYTWINGTFSSGLTVAYKNGYYNEGSEFGYLDSHGKEVGFELGFDKTYPFSEGLSAVVKDGKVGFINTDMELVIPFKFDYFTHSEAAGIAAYDSDAYTFINGKAVMENYNLEDSDIGMGEYGFQIDKKGEVVNGKYQGSP